jgi:hypothetical protein
LHHSPLFAGGAHVLADERSAFPREQVEEGVGDVAPPRRFRFCVVNGLRHPTVAFGAREVES